MLGIVSGIAADRDVGRESERLQVPVVRLLARATAGIGGSSSLPTFMPTFMGSKRHCSMAALSA